MGGYNTTYEALGVGQRPIIVPRVRPVSEQLIRARALQELGLAQCLHPDALAPATLQAAVRTALGTPATGARAALRFDGLEHIANAVLDAGRLQAGVA